MSEQPTLQKEKLRQIANSMGHHDYLIVKITRDEKGRPISIDLIHTTPATDPEGPEVWSWVRTLGALDKW